MIVQNILEAHRAYERACEDGKTAKELIMLLNAYNRWYKMATFDEQGEFHHIFDRHSKQGWYI